MDGSSFDRLVLSISEGASRRGLLRSAFAATFAGLGVASLFGSEDAEAKSCKAKCNKKKDKKAKKKCKKKCDKNEQNAQCKTSGVKCTKNSSECCSAQNLICEVPTGSGNSDTFCCGSTGSPCGGADALLTAIPPLCCAGGGGFVCSSTTPTPGTCQPAP